MHATCFDQIYNTHHAIARIKMQLAAWMELIRVQSFHKSFAGQFKNQSSVEYERKRSKKKKAPVKANYYVY